MVLVVVVCGLLLLQELMLLLVLLVLLVLLLMLLVLLLLVLLVLLLVLLLWLVWLLVFPFPLCLRDLLCVLREWARRLGVAMHRQLARVLHDVVGRLILRLPLLTLLGLGSRQLPF